MILEKVKSVVGKIQKHSFFDAFLFLLNKSVLAGEYCHNDCFELLKDLQQELADKIEFLYSEDTDTNDGLIQELQASLLCVKYYRELQKQFYHRVKRPDKLNVIRVFGKSDNNIRSNEKLAIQVDQFIKQNIKLCEIDLGFSIKVETLRELIRISHLIEDSSSSPFKKILQDKCDCLIYKFLKKFEKDPRNYIYSLNFLDKEISNKSKIDQESLFFEFTKNCELHYTVEELNSRDRQEFNRLNDQIKSSKESLRAFHGVIKYYKDINKDSSKLLGLDEFMPNKFNEEYKNLNDYALGVSSQNYRNNIISVELENYVPSRIEEYKYELFTKTKDYFEKAKSMQADSMIQNYFPFYKILSIVPKLVENLYHDFEINQRLLVDFIDLFDEIEKALFEATEWCSDRNFIAYNCNYNDCITKKMIQVDQTKEEYKLFLYSSCILPINFNKVSTRNIEIRNRIQVLKSLFTIKTSTLIDKEELNSAKRKVEENERKNIEILSIFAAIVLFVTANVQLFSQVQSFTQGLMFTLSMAYILCLFILVIWLITRFPGFHKDQNIYSNYDKLPSIHKLLFGSI